MAESTVLVTGGTGTLGRRLVPLLVESRGVRVLSRRERLDLVLPPGVEVAKGDLLTGEGVERALGGIDTIVHAASSPFRRTQATDVEGTRRLLETAKAVGEPHVVYTSIVGVDLHPLRYYRAKFKAERLIESSGLPHTILRATQFHDLLDQMLRRLAALPLVPVAAGFKFQPVETREVAQRVADLVDAGPAGRVDEMGGPQVRVLRDLAKEWLQARGKRRPVVSMPVPGRVGRAFREGLNTCPDQAVGKVTWEEFLSRTS